MAWLSVDKDGTEVIHDKKPSRGKDMWGYVPTGRYGSYDAYGDFSDFVVLPKGSIEKLIGRELKWEDNPVELV